VAAIARRPPSRISGSSELMRDEHVDAASEEVRNDHSCTAERHMNEVDAGLHLEHRREMLRGAHADRTEGQLVGEDFASAITAAPFRRAEWRARPSQTARRRPG